MNDVPKLLVEKLAETTSRQTASGAPKLDVLDTSKSSQKTFERFGAQWTPTIQVLDSDVPKVINSKVFCRRTTFLAQLGLAHAAFG